MRRAALVLAVAGALAVPAGVSAYPPITCGRVAYAGASFVVHSHGPVCDFALHWTKHFLRYHHGPRGFRCRSYGTDVPAYCQDARRRFRYFFANPAS